MKRRNRFFRMTSLLLVFALMLSLLPVFYRENFEKLVGYAYRFLKNWDDAKEVTQEAFLTALIRIDRFHASENQQGWIKSVLIYFLTILLPLAWGFFLGLVAAIFIAEAAGEVGAVLCILIGTVSLPILTYTSPAVNRFFEQRENQVDGVKEKCRIAGDPKKDAVRPL